MFAEYIITAIWAISLVGAMIASVYQLTFDGNVSFINWGSLKPSMAILFIAFLPN
ncbi:N-glycosyltransferase [Actinobacillus equuli]|nr:N-glycosyltransferase [Actinobacillus equuli]